MKPPLIMLSDSEYQLLGHLRYIAHHRRRGGQWGERRATRRGDGLEFADFRDYSPGDNPRRVDWNLYARLDRPYVRLFEEQEELHVAVLVDGSGSMGWEDGPVNRWAVVQKLALALGGIALRNGDRLEATGTGPAIWGPHRGYGYFPTWQTWVSMLAPRGDASIGTTMQQYASHATRPALVVVLTDGYDVEDLAQGAVALAAHGHEIILCHVLTPGERAPSLQGDVRLVDTETGAGLPVNIDLAALDAYRQKLDGWCRDLRSMANKHNGRYVILGAELPLHRLLLEDLRDANVLR
ncbi:MAG: DUF58 domain-containing protein [Anaerolineae bacterium]|nr:DUF58 domain-containing protein [Anaerolineae bacterium]